MENDTGKETLKNIYDFADNKVKIDYQANNEKVETRLREYNRNFSEDEKILKRNYVINRNENTSYMEIRKEYMKNYHCKRKDLLNNLINCVEELKNV